MGKTQKEEHTYSKHPKSAFQTYGTFGHFNGVAFLRINISNIEKNNNDTLLTI